MKSVCRPAALVPVKYPHRALLPDLRQLILTAREHVARAIDGRLALLYWEIGQRIRLDILREKRASYGEQIVATLSHQLIREFGSGYSEKSLRRMLQFAEQFSDSKIVATLSRQLGWSHFVEILPVEDPLAREFYPGLCRVERPHSPREDPIHALRAHGSFPETDEADPARTQPPAPQ